MIDFEGKNFHFDTRYWDTPHKLNSVSLYQIGDLSCKSGFEIGEHQQCCFEVSYIISGKGTFIVNSKEYKVKKGDLFLCKPDDVHNLIADEADPFRYLYLAFFFNNNPNLPNPYFHIEKMLLKITNPCMQDKNSINVPFKALLKEMYNPTEYSQQMIESYVMQIIIMVYRNFCGEWSNLTKTKGRSKEKLVDSFTNELVYSVISYIDNNIYNITSLKQISDNLNYSYSHLGHLFVTETGISLQEYYNKKRIENAVDLMKETKLNLNDIAEKLQYQSIHSFSKAFKKAMGVSPSEYRQLIQKNDHVS